MTISKLHLLDQTDADIANQRLVENLMNRIKQLLVSVLEQLQDAQQQTEVPLAPPATPEG